MRWKGEDIASEHGKIYSRNIVFFPQINSNLESPILKVNPFIYIVIYIMGGHLKFPPYKVADDPQL